MEVQIQQQIQAFFASAPNRLAIELAAGALVLIVLGVSVRGPLGTLFRILLFFGALAVIVAGTAILMNGVSLAGPPNPAVRLYRFLTVNWAATSDTGDSAALCADPAGLVARRPVDVEHHDHRRVRRRAEASPNADRAAAAGAAATRDADGAGGAGQDFPELVRSAYPGIPPARLMDLAASTISALPGWQIVNSDAKTLTINAVYRTRLLGFVDDIRVIVTPRSEVDVCSRSRVGEADAQSPLSFMHGDFGANIGHIKEFDRALAPAANEAYRELEIEQTAQQHGVRPSRP